MQLGDVRETTASIKNLKKINKKNKFTNLNSGIKSYINWFKRKKKLMFADNDYYGHRFILSKYCKVKIKNCFATIQHGILTPPQEKNLGKRKFIFSPFYVGTKGF